jgi:hypothetical protein
MRRAITDALISACAIGVLLLALVAMDGSVREQVTSRVDGARASSDVAATSAEARKLGSVVYQIVREQSEEHRPLMIMLLVGVGLGLIMFRT